MDRYIYPGPNTTVTYGNGTTVTFENFANVKLSMRNVTDGLTFYKRFCNPRVAEAAIEGEIAQTPQLPRKPGYPTPFLSSNDSVVTAYYIDDPGFEDVAVLFVSGFDPQFPPVFQRAIDMFIARCKLDGKSKIVIDLSTNGGGYIFQGYDMFRQFFPNNKEIGYNRWRENPQFLAMAEIISTAVAGVNPKTESNKDLVNLWESWWNYRYDLNVTGNHFESFPAKFAPRTVKGDPYTALLQWNMNDDLTTRNETFGLGIEVTGYGIRSNFTQPFPAENIIMLTDGYCASTCSLFSTFMKWNGGVKTVSFGGRPNGKPMQGVGGVKGAQVLSYNQIWNTSQELILQDYAPVSEAQKTALLKLSDLPTNRSSNARLNVRDQILVPNVADGLPAQFAYEPADCRLYYTLDMLKDPKEMWKAAAAAAWDGSPCVAGAGFAKKKGGMRKRHISAEVKEKAKRAAQVATKVVTVDDVAPEEWASVDFKKIEKFNQRVPVTF
jgi:hypothetical protein